MDKKVSFWVNAWEILTVYIISLFISNMELISGLYAHEVLCFFIGIFLVLAIINLFVESKKLNDMVFLTTVAGTIIIVVNIVALSIPALV